tara:strand:+ start:1171 stop:1368 length:198 start_codon:yes stop_codon:yes gene_type:complete
MDEKMDAATEVVDNEPDKTEPYVSVEEVRNYLTEISKALISISENISMSIKNMEEKTSEGATDNG